MLARGEKTHRQLSQLVSEVQDRGSFFGGRRFSVFGDGDEEVLRPHNYSMHTVEMSIYAKDGGVVTRSNLHKIGLIPVENDDIPSPYILRCLLDYRVLWMDVLMLLCVLATCVVTPFTFIWGGSWSNVSHMPGGYKLLVTDLLLDLYYGVCMAIRLRTSFMAPNRRVEVVNEKTILMRHCLDPLYWLCCLSVLCHFWTGACGVGMLINNLKIIRPIREICWLPDSLWQFRDSTRCRVGRPLLLLILGAHWVACLLANLGGFQEAAIVDGRVDEYITHFKGTEISGWVSLYFMAFVESIYMLTGSLDNPLGEGDSVRIKQFGSLLIVAIFGPIGCVIVAFFIGAIVREQALSMALDIRHEENKAFMKKALRNLDIPLDLQKRVFSLHEFQKMCHDREAFGALFDKNNLSPPLNLALRVYLYHDGVLSKSPYLKDKDPNYVMEIISGLEDQVYLPGDFVTRRGQVGSAMFFVLRGQLAVLVPNGPGARSLANAVEVSKKYRGDYFGEIALIKDSVRTAWVRADTFVLTSRLTRDYAESIWKHYPNERKFLADMVVQTALADRQRAKKLTQTGGFTNIDTMVGTRTMNGAQEEGPIAEEVGVAPPLAMSTSTVQQHQQSQPMMPQESIKEDTEMMCSPASDALLEAADGNVEPMPMPRVRYDSELPPEDLVTQEKLSEMLKEQVTETRKIAGNTRLQMSGLQRQQAALTAKVEAVIALLSVTKPGAAGALPPAPAEIATPPAVTFGRAVASSSKLSVPVTTSSNLDME